MTFQTQVTEKELRKAFADSLDNGISRSAIIVSYREGQQTRTEVGVVYSILRPEYHREGASLGQGPLCLEIGPYFKDIVTSPPSDHPERKRQIPISDILGYKRIELSDILCGKVGY